VLSDAQEDLARVFATTGIDKFEGVAWSPAPRGSPLLEGALAHLEGEILSVSSHGDHDVAVVGVDFAESHAGFPLLYYRGGFGGLASFVNPTVTDKIVDRRIGQSEADYLTYCAMCRDNFARRGKRAIHVLDLLFPGSDDPAARPDPGFSMRQENRGRLKRQLLRDVWKEAVNEPAVDIELVVSADVQADLERKLILLDDVRQTIRHAEASGTKLIDPKTGHFIASHRLVAMTYWVEYAVEDGRYVVFRAYSHRMQLG